MQWQDISTAPKDGSEVLVYMETRPPSIEVAYFSDTVERWFGMNGGESSLHYVTHWMPLPPPPGEKGNA